MAISPKPYTTTFTTLPPADCPSTAIAGKETKKKQVYKLEPKQGKEEWLSVVFKGTHGKQELKEDRNTLAKNNLIIEEIAKEDIPEDAEVFSVDDTWE